MRIAAFVAVLVVALGGAAATVAKPPVRPLLLLVDLDPVTFQGRHFRARERVEVTVMAGGDTLVRRIRASRNGTFKAVFTPLRNPDPCTMDAFAERIGRRGTLVAAKLPQRLCPPPLSPGRDASTPAPPQPAEARQAPPASLAENVLPSASPPVPADPCTTEAFLGGIATGAASGDAKPGPQKLCPMPLGGGAGPGGGPAP